MHWRENKTFSEPGVKAQTSVVLCSQSPSFLSLRGLFEVILRALRTCMCAGYRHSCFQGHEGRCHLAMNLPLGCLNSGAASQSTEQFPHFCLSFSIHFFFLLRSMIGYRHQVNMGPLQFHLSSLTLHPSPLESHLCNTFFFFFAPWYLHSSWPGGFLFISFLPWDSAFLASRTSPLCPGLWGWCFP